METFYNVCSSIISIKKNSVESEGAKQRISQLFVKLEADIFIFVTHGMFITDIEQADGHTALDLIQNLLLIENIIRNLYIHLPHNPPALSRAIDIGITMSSNYPHE